MSRSRRHTSITGMTTARSEKWDKREANRRARRLVREVLGHEPEADALPHLREVSSVWTFEKDGKQWFDPRRYPKDMRK